MNITDEELLMIEHLTYLNESVASAAKIDDFDYINNKYESYTISQILNKFDSTAIANLEAQGDKTFSADVSGDEWSDCLLNYILSIQSI